MSWLSHALILRHRTTRAIFVGIIAFSLGAGSTALAVRGFLGSDNLFHMCAANGGGVRVLDVGDTCKNSEVGFSVPSQAYVDALQTNADSEAAARKQGDADTLAAGKQYTDSAVANEAAARQTADGTLQTNLDSETAARKQGDADTLAAGKQYTESAVANEAAARQAADTTLQTNLDSETAARKQADADETAARRQADADEAAARQRGDADTLAAANAYTDAHAGGSLALTILSTRVSNPAQLDPGGTLTASVSCGAGRRLIGGGASMNNSNVVLYQSFPASTLQWTASARAVATVAPFGAGLTVYAICAG